MERIKIITDSASDLTAEYIKKYDIGVIPMSILFPDGKQFYERVDITDDEFYDMILKYDTPPKTSQIATGLFEEQIEKHANDYDVIIIVTISSAGSSTYANALKARENMLAKGIDVRIEVFDSLSYTGGYGAIVYELGRMNKEGMSADKLCESAQFMIDNKSVHAIINDLKILKAGGRLKPLSFTLGSLLDIKPVIIVEDGLLVQKEKVRGIRRAGNCILELNQKITPDGDGYIFALGCTTDNGTYDSIKQRALEMFPKADFYECRIGAVVGCHVGHGVTFTAMIKKNV